MNEHAEVHLLDRITALSRQSVFRWTVCSAYAATIGVLSLLPNRKLPRVPGIIPHADKFAHVGMYAVFAGLLLWALGMRHRARTAAATVVASTCLYGAIMEVLQALLTDGQRSFSIADMLANAGGTLLAVCIGIKTVEGRRSKV